MGVSNQTVNIIIENAVYALDERIKKLIIMRANITRGAYDKRELRGLAANAILARINKLAWIHHAITSGVPESQIKF